MRGRVFLCPLPSLPEPARQKETHHQKAESISQEEAHRHETAAHHQKISLLAGVPPGTPLRQSPAASMRDRVFLCPLPSLPEPARQKETHHQKAENISQEEAHRQETAAHHQKISLLAGVPPGTPLRQKPGQVNARTGFFMPAPFSSRTSSAERDAPSKSGEHLPRRDAPSESGEHLPRKGAPS